MIDYNIVEMSEPNKLIFIDDLIKKALPKVTNQGRIVTKKLECSINGNKVKILSSKNSRFSDKLYTMKFFINGIRVTKPNFINEIVE